MPINFSIYLTQLATALQAENGTDLAFLLRPTSPHGKDLLKELRFPTVRHVCPEYSDRLLNEAASHLNNFRTMKEVLKILGTRLPFNTC
jgi:hypothetical protein